MGINPGTNINDPADDRALRLPDLPEPERPARPSTSSRSSASGLETFVDVLNVLGLRTTTAVAENDGQDFGVQRGRMAPFRIRLGLTVPVLSELLHTHRRESVEVVVAQHERQVDTLYQAARSGQAGNRLRAEGDVIQPNLADHGPGIVGWRRTGEAHEERVESLAVPGDAAAEVDRLAVNL